MMRLSLLIVSLAIFGLAEDQGTSTKPRNSLAFSCLGSPFISLYAAGPSHITFPAVGLTLTDPLWRSGGYGTRRNTIPHSRYARVFEIPDAPERSKSLALEICNAKQGVYEFEVTELANESYLLGVRGNAKTENGAALELEHVSEKGRVRRYRFIFKIEGRRLILNWLDKNEKERIWIEDSEW
jgi:hypothetical protein